MMHAMEMIHSGSIFSNDPDELIKDVVELTCQYETAVDKGTIEQDVTLFDWIEARLTKMYRYLREATPEGLLHAYDRLGAERFYYLLGNYKIEDYVLDEFIETLRDRGEVSLDQIRNSILLSRAKPNNER